MKYNVTITETLSRIIEVEAESVQDAEDKVWDMYYKEDIILSARDYEDTEITDVEPIYDEGED